MHPSSCRKLRALFFLGHYGLKYFGIPDILDPHLLWKLIASFYLFWVNNIMLCYLDGKLQKAICYNCRWGQLAQIVVQYRAWYNYTFNAIETKFCWQSHSAAKTLVRFHWFLCSYCCSSLASDQTQPILQSHAFRTMIMLIVWRVLDLVISDELSIFCEGLM